MKKDEIYCRTCYGHLAGKVGVALTKSLIQHQYIKAEDGVFHVTPGGRSFFESFAIDLDNLRNKKRIFSKACTDGSEKQLHLGGSLGVAFTNKMIELGWFKHTIDSRALEITDKGLKGLKKLGTSIPNI